MQKVKISNERSQFITLLLEPWGEDYGMLPKDEFEIIAVDAGEDFYFHIVCDEKTIFVHAEGTSNDYPRVYQDGKELLCGHNRREELS